MQFKLGNNVITINPWNRKNMPWRILLICVAVAWMIWGVIIFKEGREIDARIQAQQQEELTRQAIERRKSLYEQQAQEQRRIQTGSQNIMDTLPGGEL